jgi:hypothetical protein
MIPDRWQQIEKLCHAALDLDIASLDHPHICALIGHEDGI